MGHGIELSYDNAATWKTLRDTGSDPIHCIEFGPIMKPVKRTVYWFDSGFMYCSIDGGISTYNSCDWTGKYDPNAIGASPIEPNVCYAFGYDTVSVAHAYKTEDYGKTWSEVGTLGGKLTQVSQVAVDPKNADHAVVAAIQGALYTPFGVWESTDGGVTWAPRWNGEPKCWFYETDPMGGAASCCFFPSGNWYAGGHWGGFHCETKMVILDPSHNFILDIQTDGNEGSLVRWMKAASIGASRAIAIAENADLPYGVMLSTSRGSTWTDISSGSLPRGNGNNRCAISVSGMTLYVSIPQQGLYVSKDAGATWTRKKAYVGGNFVSQVVADPLEENWVWLQTVDAINKSTLYLSKNQGATWKARRSWNDTMTLYDVTINMPVVSTP